jgi:hypothetical protein
MSKKLGIESSMIDFFSDKLTAKQVPSYAAARGVYTTEAALSVMRCRGTGPKWSKLPAGNLCIYTVADVDAWIEQQKQKPQRPRRRYRNKTAANATVPATHAENTPT